MMNHHDQLRPLLGRQAGSRCPEDCPRCARCQARAGSSVYDPANLMGKMFFNILATFAEFEADLIRLRPRGGMTIARARSMLRGKQPKLSDRQRKEQRRMHHIHDGTQ